MVISERRNDRRTDFRDKLHHMRLKMSPESQQQVSGFLRICGTARCESYSVEDTVQARHRLTAHTVKNKQGGRGSLHPQLAHTQRINSFNTCNKELFKRDPSSFINHISCYFFVCICFFERACVCVPTRRKPQMVPD